MNLSRTLDIEADYRVDYLVTKLQENKATHIEEYKKAMEEYLKLRASKAQFLVSVADKIAGEPTIDDTDVMNAYSKLTSLKKPVDASKMYDQYINLLRASESKSVRLTLSDANAIVLDQWDWAVSAKMTNTSYIASSAANRMEW